MVNNIEIPYFFYEDVCNYANDFLNKYHPSRKIPIPVEEIAEFQMGINVIPLPGLHRVLEVDGLILSNLSDLYVD